MAANTSCGFTGVAGLAALGSLAPVYDGFTMLLALTQYRSKAGAEIRTQLLVQMSSYSNC